MGIKKDLSTRSDGRQAPVKWEVCSSSIRLSIIWPDDPAPLIADLPCLLVPIPTLSADHLHGALWQHPTIKPIVNEIVKGQSYADVSVGLDIVDGALGNDRLHYHAASTILEPQVTSEILLCGNHSDHHIDVSTINLFGVDMLNTTFAATQFCGTNFGRLQ